MAAPVIRHLLASVAGALAGFASGLVPGLHVNTLAALVQAAPPAPGALAAMGLVAAFAASAFSMAVVGTFLGVADEGAAAHALPAHRLLREGRGYEAGALAAHATFLGVVGSLVLAVPLRYVLGAPLHGFRAVAAATPWLLLALAAATLASERGRIPTRRVVEVRPFGIHRVRGRVREIEGPEIVVVTPAGRRVRLLDDLGLVEASAGDDLDLHGTPAWVPGPGSRALARALALLLWVLAGALGTIAFGLGATSPWGLPGSPLLPLLAGLFGVPGLVDMLRAREPPARQHVLPPRWRWRRLGPALAAGTLCGGLIGLLPGLTAAHAATAALATRRDRNDEVTLVTLGATQGAGLGFTLLAWTALGRARSGALVAAEALAPRPAWARALPGPEVPLVAAALLLGATLGLGLALGASRGLARAAARIPERGLAGVALGLILMAVFAFTGPIGLLELAVAAAIGILPLRWGLRRVHGMAVVLVPAILGAWGLR